MEKKEITEGNEAPLFKLDSYNAGKIDLESLIGEPLYWAKRSLEQDLSYVDRINEDTFNRIIWHSIKGYDVPYPVLSHK